MFGGRRQSEARDSHVPGSRERRNPADEPAVMPSGIDRIVSGDLKTRRRLIIAPFLGRSA